MIYFLLIITLHDAVMIESYATRAECEIRREEVRIDHPGVSTTCLRMESKNSV
jgi:hypothetical protein